MLLAKNGGFIMKDLDKIINQCETNAIPDKDIDFSDIPPITDFSGFSPMYPEYFTPKREQVSIRFNKILVDHFKSMGKGWQTKVNDFLMDAYLSGKF